MDPTADRRLAPPLDAGDAGSGGREVVIDLSSSDSETESDDPCCGGDGKRRPLRAAGGGGGRLEKKLRFSAAAVEVPPGFLDPLPPPQRERSVTKQFWKAGDYDGRPLGNEVVQHSGNGLPLKSLDCFRCSNFLLSDSGMDHVRVHPKFLHSNATSHKWALGGTMFLCKVANGATYVNIDMMENKKDGTRMLLVQDNGGGMNPDKMRHCMSLGYSAKSKLKNTIGQYGNGFKTSTMRLGAADVLVFSRSHCTEGTRLSFYYLQRCILSQAKSDNPPLAPSFFSRNRPTQSIGMLSYTFLRSTSKEDIIVPMIDYEREQVWKKKVRTTWADWHISLETIIEWSPYSAEAELLQESFRFSLSSEVALTFCCQILEWIMSGCIQNFCTRMRQAISGPSAVTYAAVNVAALAELLDNSLDEVANGATYVNIDMMENKKDGTRMLLVQDNGGGMNPDKMRHCMSLGYSAKSKLKNTIGQYGNGFKTSTMRLGADVLVFSRSHCTEGTRPTQSIGMLSYTFLRSTSKEDIIVPMLDSIGEQGTRIIIYNLWEDEEGQLELDFDADANDIQIRGANRDQKRIKMANQYPNSKHFFTYKHSLRSYASILYLRVPCVFRMILRGKEIQHHNIVNDLMLKKQQTYKPTMIDGFPKDEQMVADVTIGFVKDAKHHIDIQGFNVYHKNRLIKVFYLCHAYPIYSNKKFFSVVLFKVAFAGMSDNHHKIGYGINHANTKSGTGDRDGSPDDTAHKGPSSRQFGGKSNKNMKTSMPSWEMSKYSDAKGQLSSRIMFMETTKKSARTKRSKISVLHGLSHISDDDNDGTEIAGITSRLTSPIQRTPKKYFHNESDCLPSSSPSGVKRSERIAARHQLKVVDVTSNGDEKSIVDHEAVIKKLKDENSSLKKSILMIKESLSRELQTERDKNKSLIERVSSIKISHKILSLDAFVI
ncbi:hypothetical protein PR202_ga00718 [Eleusine coracana subsp. coracana]|uniref:Morc S5 domain-containing protein n=1 Tax=Eleusine coracana subsp. coracana TaxID=191504 RepID=A0AAV5BH10_ELECO|nr:hypothetical protein PR202_ga00718 [Eleusine coracana subsp. coracana]